jgi:ABC-type multidrug transport system permease subunit
MMLRAVWLTIGKEFLLIRRDRVGLFMLIIAPIAVIAAAGFSLAKIYGGRTASRGGYTVAIVDEDHGAIGRAILDAIARQPGLAVLHSDGRAEAEDLVRRRKLAVVGIVIPKGTTEAIEHGEKAQLVLFTDPVKYLQTIKIELMIADLCREITAAAADQARKQALEQTRGIREQIERARTSAEHARVEALRLSSATAASRAALAARIRAQVERALNNARDRTKATLDSELDRIQRKLDADSASRQAKLNELEDYLNRLEVAHTQFESWLAQLKTLAGSHSGDIPPPPTIPSLPSDLDLGALNSAPVDELRDAKQKLESALNTQPINIEMPEIPALPKIPAVDIPQIPALDSHLSIPGTLGYAEVDENGNEVGAVGGFNAFDLQVPGFAVTFLLIGMLMGVSLALIDEHDWGTLERLRSASAPLWTTLTGKLLARFVVGFIQMIVLLAAGWALFGISLGHAPAALLMPASAIAFAGAAFGLIVAGIGRTRDAVLPVGAIVIMTMAAIGGCWWPIDFEPMWMQNLALALPTTWAMRAFNDLMIRHLTASSALVPTAVNFGFGIIYTIFGVAIARRRFG